MRGVGIEVIQIGHNPVTAWERFALDLTPGHYRRHWSDVDIDKRAQGKYWASSFTMHDDRIALMDFFNNGLGREVRKYNSLGDAAFEGQITGMTLSGIGSRPRKISLEPVGNKITVRYKDAAGTFRRATAQSTDSQAKYGIIELPLSAGQLTAVSLADGLALQVLARKEWPKAVAENLSLSSGGLRGSNERSIKVECEGYIRTMARRTYNQTASTGTQSADLEMADIITAVGQFVAAMRLMPTPIGVTKEHDADRDPLGIMVDTARLGDALSPPQRAVIYMEPYRIFAYEPAASPIRVSA